MSHSERIGGDTLKYSVPVAHPIECIAHSRIPLSATSEGAPYTITHNNF